ncbi:rhamnogalacturonan lyase [Catellatospora methionotrophica]|uniref:Rhamnogalacturonan lyase n=1 Tax=Catellatospora methionotrophica TaxID=121620 RepID=A0A8J3PEQ3_9ACTN|nr:cellulose binding domain-containing protein [Catellatospora methionotrophica]GIG12401.1 rhamnogalacturonan lyase [Catellatospora methionotrophica]
MPTRTRRRLAVLTAATVTVLTAGVVTAVSAQAAAGCRVDYAVTNQWGGGFGANVTITNLGDPVNGWTLTWAYTAGQAVTQLWGGSFTQSGANVSVTDAGYNAQIATNASTAFGFNASWNNSSNPAPASFALNGTTCTGAPAPTSAAPSASASPRPSASPSAPASPSPSPSGQPPSGAKQMEDLNRGLVSVRSGSANLVSWRLLGTESYSTGFNVYRGGTKVNASPITNSTNYLDSGAAADASYTVRAVVNGTEQAASASSLRFAGGNYLDVPISAPASGYSANDASVGDLDGDGQYEIVLKWDPDNAKDNSQSGVTGNVYVDAYRLNGSRMWRIDLGRNIRAGAHYTQFQVYDYDGDGRAEVAMKTADATRDGVGTVIGNASADYRNSSGYILTGPEYLTMFNGLNGAALSTVGYEPARGTVSAWGDNYGNRVDRFLAGTAYLDGTRPSLIMSRGYYTRTVIVAWDFRNGSLTRRWTFDSNSAGSAYAGQGNHQLSIGDVDADGRDEIIFGAMTINDNGTPLWNTGRGHGDALHVGDFVPSRAGLEVFKVSESTSQPGSWLADARTGQVLWSTATGADNGRGVAGDIWAGSPGAEAWSASDTTLRNTANGASLGREPGSINFLVWWDGDPVRELLDGTHIDKYGTSGDTRLLTGSNVASNNGTKSTPALSADLFGDWREEVIWRTSDNTALRIYATTSTTDRRIHTLMHDPMYRVAVAWQNTAYNQPPHPSFFLGDGMSTPPSPNIYLR